MSSDLDWIKIVEPVMRSYTEATDGSCIEPKESALVWHHQDADSDFGSCQAKELLDHLENVLANEPAVVKRGQHIVEVKPQVFFFIVGFFLIYHIKLSYLQCNIFLSCCYSQGVSKGLVAEKVLSRMVDSGRPPDFVMCIGDDRSDEDMFESISSIVSSPSLPSAPEIFACTVGRKPSKAKFYLDDTSDVVKLLQGLASTSRPRPRQLPQMRVSFESVF